MQRHYANCLICSNSADPPCEIKHLTAESTNFMVLTYVSRGLVKCVCVCVLCLEWQMSVVTEEPHFCRAKEPYRALAQCESYHQGPHILNIAQRYGVITQEHKAQHRIYKTITEHRWIPSNVFVNAVSVCFIG